MAGAIVSTGKVDYTTTDDENLPIVSTVRNFFRAMRAVQTGKPVDPRDPGIDLDPCSNPSSIVRAALNIQLEPVQVPTLVHTGADGSWSYNYVQADGLAAVWHNQRTYVNPPFGRKKGGTSVTDWVMKEEETLNAEVVYCIPDTPETNLWKNHILLFADGRCQLRKRVVFGNMYDKNGKPVVTGIPKPISLVYFGQYPHLFKQYFRTLGRVECPFEVYADQTDIML